MGKLVVTEFTCLDGIVEDPAGQWVAQFDQGAEAAAFKLRETLASECLLLGRVTYEGFARSWPQEHSSPPSSAAGGGCSATAAPL
jgi:hypothetical protein